MLIGILALQGDFFLHSKILKSMSINTTFVKTPIELDLCDALIIPGGESSVISKLIKKNYLYDKIINFSKSKSIFGTCAGMIMMAKNCNDKKIDTLNILDIWVDRNAWGRQIKSFNSELIIKDTSFNAIFIRAPKVTMIGNSIQVLGKIDNEPVLISNGRHLAASFHPELTNDTTVHRMFIEKLIK